MKACIKLFSLLSFFLLAIPFGALANSERGGALVANEGVGALVDNEGVGALATNEDKGALLLGLGQTLRNDVQFLSNSLCEGRATGTRGGVEASSYLLRRLSEMGLKTSVQSFRVDSTRIGRNIYAGALSADFGFCAEGASVNNIVEANGGVRTSNSTNRKLTVIMAYYDGLGILGGKMYAGADSNASGVAALLALADRLKDRTDILFVFLDGHNANLSGASALKTALKSRRISLVVNLDILGSTLSPVDKYWPDFLIALGADRHKALLEECNVGINLHYYQTYYRSATFTDLFYKRAGDHKAFVAAGTPTVLFTSGITSNTNKPTDTFDTLDYEIFAKRVEFIARFIQKYRSR